MSDMMATELVEPQRKKAAPKAEAKTTKPTKERATPIKASTDKIIPKLNAGRTMAPAELDRLIAGFEGGVAEVMITASLAQHILDNYNKGNRKLRANHARSFARILETGRWQNTGEAIVFAREGVLNNGQHRLLGIVESGISATIDMRFGIARAAFSVTDSGAKRLAGDVLSIHGSKNPFAAAATARMLLAFKEGLPNSYGSQMKTGNDEVLKAYEDWPEIEQVCEMTKRVLKNKKGFITAGTNAFAYLALRDTNWDWKTVETFLDLVESGLAISKQEPTRLLHELLRDPKQLNLQGQRLIGIERFALFILAWKLWRQNAKTRKLSWKSTDPFPLMIHTLQE